MKKFIVIAVLLVLVGSVLLSVSSNAIAEEEEYDYSYLTEYDYSMGNEYINYTHMNSVNFSFDETFSKPLDPNQQGDFPASLVRPFAGDFVRYKNQYYKFFFDSTDTIKLFKAHDINSYRAIDITSSNYQDKVEVQLNETFAYANYNYPITFMNNETLYLIMNEVSSGNLVMFNVSTNGTVLSGKNTLLTPYSGYTSLYPQSVVFLNETFYLFINAYDSSGQGKQDGRYVYGDSLTNLSVNDTWIIDGTTTGGNEQIHHIKYYSDKNAEYLYVSYSDKHFVNMASATTFDHIVFRLDDKYTNTSAFVPVHWENDTTIYSYTYVPVGFSLYRMRWHINTDTVGLEHFRERPNKFFNNFDVKTKVYWNGIMEYSSEYNENDDYLDFVITQFSTPNYEYMFPVLCFYIEIEHIDYNYRTSNNETMFTFNMFINNQFAQGDTKTLLFAFESGYMDIFDDNYIFVNSNQDYFWYASDSVMSFGIGRYPVFSLSIANIGTLESYQLTGYHNPQDLTQVILAGLVQSPIEEKIGYIALIVGAVLGGMPFLTTKIDKKYSWYGFYLFLIGVFLLSGLGILGLML